MIQRPNRPPCARITAKLLMIMIVAASLTAVPALAWEFHEGFEGPAGLLGSPWVVYPDGDASPFQVDDGRVYAPADLPTDYAGMYRDIAGPDSHTLIEYECSFNGDLDGCFRLSLGGNFDEPPPWGFYAEIRLLTIELTDISTGTGPSEEALLDPWTMYTVTLDYGPDSGVELRIEAAEGGLVGWLEMSALAPEFITHCAVAIDNQLDSEKWIDNVHCRSYGSMLTVSGEGELHGHDGYYIGLGDTDGNWGEINFMVEEPPYIRLHAYLPYGEQDYVPYPAGCYIVKTTGMNVGDTWQSHNDGITDAHVVVREPVETLTQTFNDAYRVEYYSRDVPTDLKQVIWWVEDVGIVRLGDSLTQYQDFNSHRILGGSGFLPLALNNTWRTGYWVDAAAVKLPAPAALGLKVFPNPFNPQISVRFELLTRSRATVAVYDLGGRLVRTLFDDVHAAGPHTLVWDGRDRSGRATASGTYFVRLQTAVGDATQKVSLVR